LREVGVQNLSKEKLCYYYFSYPDKVLFLDIETEGLSKERNDITVIGIYHQGAYRPFIKGLNLHRAFEFLSGIPIWVTFNGENFDIPFIKAKFPELSTPHLHIDLFQLTGAIGLKGGLKKIEKALGIIRKTEGLNGYDAVKLWRRWEEFGDKSALRTLILYNREDVVNLKRIMEHVGRLILEEAKNSFLSRMKQESVEGL
jgi:uncharacterized protein YprB with RNaseH-like and TPR domain